MVKKKQFWGKKVVASFLAIIFLVSACSPQGAAGEVSIEEETHMIDSGRGTEIPATIVAPKGSKDALPLVVFAHGFNGSRDEAGGFTLVAKLLAEKGIASVRIDFAGCNESLDDFLNYNFETMSADLKTAIDFTQTVVEIDPDRIGALGYSMGGRVVSLNLEELDIKTAVFWAPAASNDLGSAQAFGTPDELEAMITRAKKEGKASFEFFGQEIFVSDQFLQELDETKPLDVIKKFEGQMFMVTGGQDVIVPAEVTDKVIAAATSAEIASEFKVPSLDHGFGNYDGNAVGQNEVAQESANFFARYL